MNDLVPTKNQIKKLFFDKEIFWGGTKENSIFYEKLLHLKLDNIIEIASGLQQLNIGPDAISIDDFQKEYQKQEYEMILLLKEFIIAFGIKNF